MNVKIGKKKKYIKNNVQKLKGSYLIHHSFAQMKNTKTNIGDHNRKSIRINAMISEDLVLFFLHYNVLQSSLLF